MMALISLDSAYLKVEVFGLIICRFWWCCAEDRYVAKSEIIKTATVYYRHVHTATMAITASPACVVHWSKAECGTWFSVLFNCNPIACQTFAYAS